MDRRCPSYQPYHLYCQSCYESYIIFGWSCTPGKPYYEELTYHEPYSIRESYSIQRNFDLLESCSISG